MSTKIPGLDRSHFLYSLLVPELSSEPNFTLKIQLSDARRRKLDRAAKLQGLTMVDLVREWIDLLPDSSID